MAEETIIVEGLSQLVRDFGRLQKELRKELQAELRGLARIVADEAEHIAREQGLVGDPATDRGQGHPGMLVSRIKTSVRGATASVRDTAARVSRSYPEGFPYPKVYEYGGRGAGTHGPRAFLQPALTARISEIEQGLERMLDRLTSDEGLGKGGLL